MLFEKWFNSFMAVLAKFFSLNDWFSLTDVQIDVREENGQTVQKYAFAKSDANAIVDPSGEKPDADILVENAEKVSKEKKKELYEAAQKGRLIIKYNNELSLGLDDSNNYLVKVGNNNQCVIEAPQKEIPVLNNAEEKNGAGINADEKKNVVNINAAFGEANIVNINAADETNINASVGEENVVNINAAVGEENQVNNNEADGPKNVSGEAEPNAVADDESASAEAKENAEIKALADIINKEPRPELASRVRESLKRGGTLEELEAYKKNNTKKLSKNDTDYLEARIATEKFYADFFKNKKTHSTVPKRAEIRDDGTIILDHIHQDQFQTTQNGCYSCAYLLLLQSRGVNLTQQQIRAYKGDRTDIIDNDRSLGDHMGNIVNLGGIAAAGIPNTAVKELTFKNLPSASAEERNAVHDVMKKTLIESLQKHASPVAFLVGVHYMTIVGYNPKTDTITFKNSWPGVFPPPKDRDPNKPDTMKLSELLSAGRLTFTHLVDINLENPTEGLDGVEGLEFVKGRGMENGEFMKGDGKVMGYLDGKQNGVDGIVATDKQFPIPGKKVYIQTSYLLPKQLELTSQQEAVINEHFSVKNLSEDPAKQALMNEIKTRRAQLPQENLTVTQRMAAISDAQIRLRTAKRQQVAGIEDEINKYQQTLTPDEKAALNSIYMYTYLSRLEEKIDDLTPTQVREALSERTILSRFENIAKENDICRTVVRCNGQSVSFQQFQEIERAYSEWEDTRLEWNELGQVGVDLVQTKNVFAASMRKSGPGSYKDAVKLEEMNKYLVKKNLLPSDYVQPVAQPADQPAVQPAPGNQEVSQGSVNQDAPQVPAQPADQPAEQSAPVQPSDQPAEQSAPGNQEVSQGSVNQNAPQAPVNQAAPQVPVQPDAEPQVPVQPSDQPAEQSAPGNQEVSQGSVNQDAPQAPVQPDAEPQVPVQPSDQPAEQSAPGNQEVSQGSVNQDAPQAPVQPDAEPQVPVQPSDQPAVQSAPVNQEAFQSPKVPEKPKEHDMEPAQKDAFLKKMKSLVDAMNDIGDISAKEGKEYKTAFDGINGVYQILLNTVDEDFTLEYGQYALKAINSAKRGYESKHASSSKTSSNQKKILSVFDGFDRLAKLIGGQIRSAKASVSANVPGSVTDPEPVKEITFPSPSEVLSIEENQEYLETINNAPDFIASKKIPNDIKVECTVASLEKFKDEHLNELNDDEEKYLNGCIASAQLYENLRKNPAQPVMKDPVADNGVILLNHIHQTEFQTTKNGCYSVAMSLLLQSRGLNLNPKQVRAFRGDGDKQPERIERDAMGNAGLLGGIAATGLINTGMVERTYPLNFKNADEMKKAEALEDVKKHILNALLFHKSPVALLVNMHYVTVVGYDLKTDKLLVKNSLQGIRKTKDVDKTLEMNLNELRDAESFNLSYLVDINPDKPLEAIDGLRHQKALEMIGDGISINKPSEFGVPNLNEGKAWRFINDAADISSDKFKVSVISTMPEKLYIPANMKPAPEEIEKNEKALQNRKAELLTLIEAKQKELFPEDFVIKVSNCDTITNSYDYSKVQFECYRKPETGAEDSKTEKLNRTIDDFKAYHYLCELKAKIDKLTPKQTELALEENWVAESAQQLAANGKFRNALNWCAKKQPMSARNMESCISSIQFINQNRAKWKNMKEEELQLYVKDYCKGKTKETMTYGDELVINTIRTYLPKPEPQKESNNPAPKKEETKHMEGPAASHA